MQFICKLTKADMREVRKMTRARTYWLTLLLWGAAMISATVKGWTVTLSVLSRTPSEWRTAAALWRAAAALILWAVYNQSRIRSRQLVQMNATRPDQMNLTSDGIKCDGPNGATALVPWRTFKGWKEGRRVILVHRGEGIGFVILPIEQLFETERQTIRQFLQSHILPARQSDAQICSKCGQGYDGNRCWSCVAREADIEETFFPCIWVAAAGVLGTTFALRSYPPLGLNFLILYDPVILVLIIVLTGFVFVHWQRATQYPRLFRLIIFLIAAAFVVPAPYYYLNGALDKNPPVVAQARFSRKSIENYGEGNSYNFVCTVSWNQKTTEESFDVSSEEFSSAQPGDAVRIVIHPGAFSHPWYSDVRLSGGREGNSR